MSRSQIPTQIDIVNLQINSSGRILDVAPNEKINVSFDYSVFEIKNKDRHYEKLNKQFVIGFIRKDLHGNTKIIGEINVVESNDKVNNEYDSDKIDDWQYRSSSRNPNYRHILFDRKCFYNEKQNNNVDNEKHVLKLKTPSIKGEYYLVISQHSLSNCNEAEEAFPNSKLSYNYPINNPLLMKDYAPRVLSESAGFNDMENNIGFSVGGAKDINNFRENIKNNFLPLPTDITYEGLFYDYYFDTNIQDECSKLFCPSYTLAKIKDLFSGNDEYYLSVGLNSGIKEIDFKRKKLNLVIVLDISGSMRSSFNEYYYDKEKNKIKNDSWTEEDKMKSKMVIANESIVSLLEHLNDDDRFGMVLFETNAHLAKPLRAVGKTDMDAIKNHIMELYQGGGTNMSAGINSGTELFNELEDINPDEYENRIIFLTDAMPNKGNMGSGNLFDIMQKNAERGIYSTVIGVGVDFNTKLIEDIIKVKGANYYSVHSSKQFKERLDDEFEYMVTPLVFDLQLSLSATGYEIEKVYGSPSADRATGDILYVNTLFPSKSVNGENKGGLILVKLKKTSDDGTLSLRTSYEDRSGKFDGQTKSIVFNSSNDNKYIGTGIMKGILLTQYANLLKNWIIDERSNKYNSAYDIYRLSDPRIELNTWERESSKLIVSKDYRNIFKNFRTYFKEKIKEVDDLSLNQEIEILDQLINHDTK